MTSRSARPRSALTAGRSGSRQRLPAWHLKLTAGRAFWAALGVTSAIGRGFLTQKQTPPEICLPQAPFSSALIPPVPHESSEDVLRVHEGVPRSGVPSG